MARVVVVGAGIAGLTSALYATTAGHHVVILERTERLGGRGTSENKDGLPFGFGPHLLMKNGPLSKLTKKISRLKMVLGSVRLDRTHVPGFGPLRPRGKVRETALIRQAFRQNDTEHVGFQAADLLCSMGHVELAKNRFKALQKGHLSVIGEGWAGLVGRMASALDEVGVLIESGCEVESIHSKGLALKDGRTLEADIVIVACGWKRAKPLLKPHWEGAEPSISPLHASTIDANLSSKPMANKHAIIDPHNEGFILDIVNIQPRLNHTGSLISGIVFGRPNESSDERLHRLHTLLDLRLSGWQEHVVEQRLQRTITVQTLGEKPAFDALKKSNILLAGEWVQSEYRLSDAATQTGKLSGQAVTKLTP